MFHKWAGYHTKYKEDISVSLIQSWRSDTHSGTTTSALYPHWHECSYTYKEQESNPPVIPNELRHIIGGDPVLQLYGSVTEWRTG